MDKRVRTPEQIIGKDALVQLIFEGYAVTPARPVEKAEIRVDTFQTLIGALERSGVDLVADPKATGHSFAGVSVIADSRMPVGFAAVVVNKAVVQIIDLRPLPAHKEQAR